MRHDDSRNSKAFCNYASYLIPCMYSFGYFPGVWLLYADVSEHSICSIFKGWMLSTGQNTAKVWNQEYLIPFLFSTNHSQDKHFSFFFNIFWPWISIYLFINIEQLDALNFIISLFQASTCFEHMCSSSGGQYCVIQSLVSSHI